MHDYGEYCQIEKRFLKTYNLNWHNSYYAHAVAQHMNNRSTFYSKNLQHAGRKLVTS